MVTKAQGGTGRSSASSYKSLNATGDTGNHHGIDSVNKQDEGHARKKNGGECLQRLGDDGRSRLENYRFESWRRYLRNTAMLVNPSDAVISVSILLFLSRNRIYSCGCDGPTFKRRFHYRRHSRRDAHRNLLEAETSRTHSSKLVIAAARCHFPLSNHDNLRPPSV